MHTYSTKEAARRIGIHWVTLHHWLSEGKVCASVGIPMGPGQTLRRWTLADVRQARAYKAAHYRKGRGRKKKRT